MNTGEAGRSQLPAMVVDGFEPILNMEIFD